jgi:hypothetical protein
MRSAAGLFLGRHVSNRSRARGYEMESTVRTLRRCEIKERTL